MSSANLNEAIIGQRMSLFSEYCVPSVLHQTTKEFTWLLYFDKATSPKILHQASRLTQGISAEIILVRSFEEFLTNIREHIMQAPTLFCITSRLDNDDLISSDFIQAVKQQFIPAHRTLINFTHGFEIDLHQHLIKKWTTRSRNQFTSLIENKERTPLTGIYGFAHGAIPGDIEIINIGESPRWAYTRHSFNFSPQKNNIRPVFTSKALSGFPSMHGFTISWWNTLNYVFRWMNETKRNRIKNLFNVR